MSFQRISFAFVSMVWVRSVGEVQVADFVLRQTSGSQEGFPSEVSRSGRLILLAIFGRVGNLGNLIGQ
jgi:hypothetical protein